MLQTEYTVVRPVRIFGRRYHPGDLLDDPKIPVGVLAVLSNTRKIGVRVQHVAAGDPEPVPGTAPAPAPPPEPVAPPVEPVEAPEPVDAPEPADAPQAPPEAPAAPPKGAAGDPVSPEPVPPQPEPPQQPVPPEPVPPQPEPPTQPVRPGDVPKGASPIEIWRGYWADRKPTDGSTFRRYMMDHLADHRLSQHGSVHDLAQRLIRGKVRPRA